jgi:NADPH:quinone reductase-like Zn-dependent oxidoreductase
MYAMALRTFKKGEPLERIELPTPEPRGDEVRVAVHAVGVNPVDWKMREGGPLRAAALLTRTLRGPRGPMILGVDFAGVVEAVGAKVTRFEVGQRVYGGTNFSRGQHGSYADTVVVRDDQLCQVPDKVPFDVAGSMTVTGVTAWMALSEYRPIEAGRRVLVLGAAGGVGQFAVQLAKRTRNAELVVGVCSAKNSELVRGLGADIVVDYNAGDALDAAKPHGPFDVVIDCAGGYSASRCRSLLAELGRHVMVAGSSPGAMAQALVPPFRSKTILGAPTRSRLQAAIDAVAAGEVVVNIAERVPLADVEAAHAKSQTGRMTGKIVLLPRGDE